MEQRHRYKKLGGFLAFFVVAFILGCVSNMVVIMNKLPGDLSAVEYFFLQGQFLLFGFQVVSIVGLAAINVLQLMAAIQIIRRQSNFSTFFILGMLSGCLGLVCSLLMIGIASAPLPPLAIGLIMVFVAVCLTVGFVLEILYILKSVRLRTYMGSDEYITKCPFLKWATPRQPAALDDAVLSTFPPPNPQFPSSSSQGTQEDNSGMFSGKE